jgi:nicotinate dehydrogenase subunit A
MSDATPPITITVNGQVQQLHVSPDTTALMALRHDLDLKGTRIGCTEGHCGACTALLDGKPVQTCNLPLWSIAGRSLTTIEALSAGGHYNMVQQAFLAEQAGQCGYCVNGIMMTVTAMLAQTPPATRAAIIETLDERHLCRCGAQPRILRAIDQAIAARGASL